MSVSCSRPKMARLAPMPTPIVIATLAASPGDRRNTRALMQMSFQISRIASPPQGRSCCTERSLHARTGTCTRACHSTPRVSFGRLRAAESAAVRRLTVYWAMRCDEIRLTGSGGANRVMEAEMKRLVIRSAFEIPVPKPRREGEAPLLYPFNARVAWVAACYHRTSSRIEWDLFSSAAVRLEPLFDELVPALQAD